MQFSNSLDNIKDILRSYIIKTKPIKKQDMYDNELNQTLKEFSRTAVKPN